MIKTYINAVAEINLETNHNAHEALNPDSYCMGSFGKQDEILISHE